MNEPDPAAGLIGAAPQTQIQEIDDALARLSSLSTTELAEHHDRLTQAHDVLQRALQAEPTQPST